MPQKKIIAENLEALNSLKDLAESYEEIAVIRMQKIKDSVLKTRDFLADLSDVFVDLKSSYDRDVKELLEKRKSGNKTILPLLQKNGKTLMVYLSSNGRLYGSVTQKTYKLFIEDLKKPESQNADLMIIGTAGRDMFNSSSYARPYTYFDIPDIGVEVDHIKQLMLKFLQYEKVHVYYGKFDNVINQTPIGTSITGENIFETETLKPISREDRFIFEPVLEKIFYFFETQIIANLFSQTLLENQFISPLLSLFHHISRYFRNCKLFIFVIFVSVSLHLNQIHHTTNILFKSNRNLNRHGMW
jgi:F0F1-type ATP synthase gamma subunit